MHRGWSPSLCCCVQQPCEYSGCVLSPDAATQCANLFQICQGVGGKYERLSRRNQSDTSPVHSADSPVTCQQMALTFTHGLMAGTEFLPETKKLCPSLPVRISCTLPLSAMQIQKLKKKKEKNKKENISPLACSCLTNVPSPLYSIPVKYKQLFCQEMSIFLNYQPVGNQITIVRGNNEQALMSKKPTNEVINLLLYDNDYALACLMASM